MRLQRRARIRVEQLDALGAGNRQRLVDDLPAQLTQSPDARHMAHAQPGDRRKRVDAAIVDELGPERTLDIVGDDARHPARLERRAEPFRPRAGLAVKLSNSRRIHARDPRTPRRGPVGAGLGRAHEDPLTPQRFDQELHISQPVLTRDGRAIRFQQLPRGLRRRLGLVGRCHDQREIIGPFLTRHIRSHDTRDLGKPADAQPVRIDGIDVIAIGVEDGDIGTAKPERASQRPTHGARPDDHDFRIVHARLLLRAPKHNAARRGSGTLNPSQR